jgi:hypothetical protein
LIQRVNLGTPQQEPLAPILLYYVSRLPIAYQAGHIMGVIDREGGRRMEIKSLTDQEKRALAEVSLVVYGEELTRIMIPELKDYLNGSNRRDESPEVIQKD